LLFAPIPHTCVGGCRRRELGKLSLARAREAAADVSAVGYRRRELASPAAQALKGAGDWGLDAVNLEY
jgi:hypothetical protein